MPDYREMYQRMLMVSEKAIDLLIKAQQECEDSFHGIVLLKIGPLTC